MQQVIKNIQRLNNPTKEAEKLIEYYQANAARMDYKTFKGVGCGIIGSGAIESAHRTVIHKRMKQSGQRWSKKGANNQWHKIVVLTKTEFRKAA